MDPILYTIRLGVLAGILGCAGQAATLVSQAPTPAGNLFISDFTFISTNQQATDFVVSEDAMLQRIDFWGGYTSVTVNNAFPPPTTDNFTIRIFTETTPGSGTPKITPDFTLALSATLARVEVPGLEGSSPGSRRIYSYSTVLTTPQLLTAGTQYYLSIVNRSQVGASSGVWQWLASPGNNTRWDRNSDAAPWTTRSGDLAFGLSGYAVPEPSSFVLAAAGVAFLAAARIMRSRS